VCPSVTLAGCDIDWLRRNAIAAPAQPTTKASHLFQRHLAWRTILLGREDSIRHPYRGIPLGACGRKQTAAGLSACDSVLDGALHVGQHDNTCTRAQRREAKGHTDEIGEQFFLRNFGR
jgi:hypothetical protein